jgi:membrane associated rhomboid family serine protease
MSLVSGGRPLSDVASVDLPAHEPPAVGLRALGPFPSEHRAREAALVLSSMSIEHALHHASSLALSETLDAAPSSAGGVFVDPFRHRGFYLVVRAADFRRASESLQSYEEENRDWPPRRTRERLRYGGLPLLALAFVAMVVFAWFTGPAKDDGRFFIEGTSVSSLVLGREPFRAVTALTLHGDGAHVMGNLLSGALFSRGVERRLGPGVGGLGVLASGAIGNLANAAYYGLVRHTEHASIGASTAVLGAVGILAATELLLRTDGPKRRWYDLAAPIAGGFALLGTIGASPSSDVGAHGFGFLAGLGVGAIAALVVRRRTVGPVGQLATGLTALGIVGGSWALALAR